MTKNTKIVATYGPSIAKPEILRAVLEAGADVIRLNFSYGAPEEHERAIRDIRAAAATLGRPVAILQDLRGPKIRVGHLPPGGIVLSAGEIVPLEMGLDAAPGAIPIEGHAGLASEVRPGEPILLDDGAIRLRVLDATPARIRCEVLAGGPLLSGKGVNLPDTRLSALETVTEKDRADLAFGIRAGVDYVALSFVRSPRDVRELRRLQSEQGAAIPIVAKIEKREALHELPQILEESDGVMVARGDLGVETDLEEVALRQKEIILACNREGKIVITATQMLESMITHPSPTRAEVSDVSNAVLDGTDAVMLSGETSVGTYPVETVAFMARIVERTEARFPRHLVGLVHPLLAEVPDAVAHAACTLAEEIRADALVCLTRSGRTAQLVSRYRPACPILALSPDAATVRRLAIVWGVEPMYGGPETASGDGVREAIECARATGRFRPGARIVITSGVRDGSLGGVTNSVRVESFP